jgi:hypothetical protein
MMTLTRERGTLEQVIKKGQYREYGVKKAEVRGFPPGSGYDHRSS